MKREFLIDEIMLDGVSGEIRGTIEFDAQSGLIDRVDCDTFCFRRSDIDSPVLLNESQRILAIDLVERVLEGQTDVADGSGQIVASAQVYSPRPAVTSGKRILAEYLAAAGRPNDDEQKRRAQ